MLKPTFSSRTNWPSVETELAALLREKKARGEEVLDLAESNPTRCGFSFYERMPWEALYAPEVEKYNPCPNGLETARDAISEYYRKRRGIVVPAEDIIVSACTSESYSGLFRILCDVSDIVLTPQPSYPLLGYLGEVSDVRLETYHLTVDRSEFCYSYDELTRAFQVNPKAVVVVNPNNPTGNYLTANDQSVLEDLSLKYNAPIIVDEVFYDYALGNETSAASFLEQEDVLTFTVSGISKVLALPQMKLAWTVIRGPTALKREALHRLEMISDTFLSLSTPAQLALPMMFELCDVIQEEIQERLRINRKSLVELLAGQSLLQLMSTGGGWNAVLAVESQTSSEALAGELLQQTNTHVYPGELFGFKRGCYLVISLLQQPEITREGLMRVRSAINDRSGVAASEL